MSEIDTVKTSSPIAGKSKPSLVGKIENSPFAILKGTPGKLKLAWKSSPQRSTTR